MYINVVTNEEVLFNARRVGEDEATQPCTNYFATPRKRNIREYNI